jgi:hypothetical protein
VSFCSSGSHELQFLEIFLEEEEEEERDMI